MSRLTTLAFIFLLALVPFLTADSAAAKPKPKHRNTPIELETGLLPAAAGTRSRGGRLSVKDRYIVALTDSAGDPRRFAAQQATDGLVPTHVYRHIFKGFAAEIPPGRLEALKRDPSVLSVTPDGIVRIAAEITGVPTGVDRIDADLNSFAAIDETDLPRVNVDVAILDSGITIHPDLNLYAEANCTTEPSAADGNGHGTHVAGIVGALDNGTGVIGVAPGARLWNIKVMGANGSGEWSWVICGLDTVTAYAPGTGHPLGEIEVANMSLGGSNVEPGTPDHACGAPDYLIHNAVCRTVAAGVTVVVAAGNGYVDAKATMPASFDEVITVSALADSDGKPGGLGPATSAGADDTFYRNPAVPVGQSGAGSNWGGDIDLAAPGVDIRSTVPSSGPGPNVDPSGYLTLTGTSMASPHVAGAAAIYIAEHGRVGPAVVKAGLLGQRERFGLVGDPDGVVEGVVNLFLPDTTPPEVAIISPIGGARVRTGATIRVFAVDEPSGSGVKSVEVRFCKGATCDFAAGKSIGIDTTPEYALKWKKPPKNGTYTLIARATDKAGNTKLSGPVTVKVKR